jgi:plastocyanin
VKTFIVLIGVLVLAWSAAATGAPGLIEATVKDEGGKAVDDAIVYLAAAPAPTRTPPSATMDQVDKEFVPAVLPVQVGTPVQFPNRDNIKHHVYSFSPPKKFELPLYIGTPSSPVLFDKPGAVVLGCNIHDWMVAHIFVVPSPYFARTVTGRASLREVPAGSHEVRVWHPRLRAATETTGQRITLVAGQPAQVTFAVALKPERKPPRIQRYDNVQG